MVSIRWQRKAERTIVAPESARDPVLDLDARHRRLRVHVEIPQVQLECDYLGNAWKLIEVDCGRFWKAWFLRKIRSALCEFPLHRKLAAVSERSDKSIRAGGSKYLIDRKPLPETSEASIRAVGSRGL